MPDLLTSLRNYDLGYLQIVADLWGIDLDSREPDPAAQELTASLLRPELVRELTDSLRPESRAALEALVARGGRIPWAEFTRLYGDVREMGAGKRDREKPHLDPASPAEALFYRAFLARAFFDTPDGPREFAYTPEDLFKMLRVGATGQSPLPLGRPATPAERAHAVPANDRILDDATTFLAALRLGITPPGTPVPGGVIQALLETAGILKKSTPQAEPVKAWLAAPRVEALKGLVHAWRQSGTFNELRQVPALVFEGEWKNPALETRQALLGFVGKVPKDKWWSLAAFIQSIKEEYPDFQRPAGDYDSWFIKRAADGAYLRGFAHWDEVDGALIRYFITGILHWLGMVDLASGEKGGVLSAFRLSSFRPPKEERGKISIGSNGNITIARSASRAARYLIARFCEWGEEKPDEYRYHVTPASLKRAKDQGLKVEHLLPLLAKHSAGIPPAFVKALQRWEVNGTEARMQSQVVLRVSRPEVLEQMRKSKAARFLGEVLSPTTVVVKDGAQSRVLTALAELGLLAEDESAKNTTSHPKGKEHE